MVSEQERVELDGAAAAAAAAGSEAASERIFIKRQEDAAGEMELR